LAISSGQCKQHLAEGLSKLALSPFYFNDKHSKSYGKFIISYNRVPLYIGEAMDYNKRINQHLKGSSFYKNYLRCHVDFLSALKASVT